MFLRWLRETKPDPARYDVWLIVAGFVLVVPSVIAVLHMNNKFGYNHPINVAVMYCVPFLMSLLDYCCFMPRALHKAQDSGFIEVLLTTPVSAKSIARDLDTWITGYNRRHMLVFLAVVPMYVASTGVTCVYVNADWPYENVIPSLLVFLIVRRCLLTGGLLTAFLPRQLRKDWVVVPSVLTVAVLVSFVLGHWAAIWTWQNWMLQPCHYVEFDIPLLWLYLFYAVFLTALTIPFWAMSRIAIRLWGP